MIDRRAFLRRLATGIIGATVGAELDIERLLWVPKSIITVPDMSFVGHNTFISPDWITREALAILENHLVMTRSFESFERALVNGEA